MIKLATLNGAINSSVTSFAVSDGTEFTINEYLYCDSEIMKITDISVNTLYVLRGQISTSAIPHDSGNTIRPYLHLRPLREPERTEKFINREIGFETGTTQIQGVTINPIIVWKLSYSGDVNSYSYLKLFFNSRCGKRKPFYWIDEEQTLHLVRFNMDEIVVKQKIQIDSDNNFSLIGYSAEVTLIKVYTDLTSSINGGSSNNNLSTIIDGGNSSGI